MAPISSFGTIRIQGGTGSKIKQDYFSVPSALFCETGSPMLHNGPAYTGRNKLISVV